MTGAQNTNKVATSHKHDGLSPHILSYIVSIILTMIAFAAVLYGGLDVGFVLILIVCLAIVQVIFQLFYWMHMKDRGHTMPIIFIAGGVVVIIPVIITALFWMWW
ncbi:cytochrome C oxidase subunit IV [Paenibacillus albiflavus]|uniref:Cytochrome C oxidase subunit IV n=1 Tax=Paenibacillus albiflavus TaxID=2545760 RepID=A0A4R4EHY7_9BACL|nr:cytochrome C oxidase subunit IV family protein [Paenibacillus albiflavus]TCZ77798.1 cytochrome C oxidase subunit IV [Paenibacillus albiflavus]